MIQKMAPKCCQEDCFHLGVKALLLSPEKKLLLLERNKRSYWDIPGGRLQKGASVLDTLKREVEEETGFTQINRINFFITTLTDIRIPTSSGDVGLIFSIFLCDISATFQPILSDEHVNFGWFSPQEAVHKLQVQYPPDFIKLLTAL